eukprot:5765762-Amphidinium_carterae.2
MTNGKARKGCFVDANHLPGCLKQQPQQLGTCSCNVICAGPTLRAAQSCTMLLANIPTVQCKACALAAFLQRNTAPPTPL